MKEPIFLIIIPFIIAITVLWLNFSDIGYINVCLSCKKDEKDKKVNVRKLRKFIYIPFEGVRTTRKNVYTVFAEKVFDGTVYKITLILALINHLLILLAITGFVISLITDIVWFAATSAGLCGAYMLVITIIRNHIEIRCNI